MALELLNILNSRGGSVGKVRDSRTFSSHGIILVVATVDVHA